MTAFTESTVESAAIAWLESLGWAVKHGPEIAPGELAAERAGYAKLVLEDCLRQACIQTGRADYEVQPLSTSCVG